MKTKFFRVAVEGATTDGRVIERAWIEQMAASYNPATYGARINMEHLRGFSPEPPFNSYGDVLSLKAEDVEIQIDGKTEKRLGLFAELEANDQLVAINRKGQKVYTSIEVNPNFSGTGKAYLMGIAVTDSPASLGTEMLQFAASKPELKLFANRKHDEGNLITEAIEANIEFAAEPATSGLVAELFSDIRKAIFGEGKVPSAPAHGGQHADPANPAGSASPRTGGDQSDAFTMTQAEKLFSGLEGAIEKAVKPTADGLTALRTELTTLKAELDKTPGANHSRRPPASGGRDQELAQF